MALVLAGLVGAAVYWGWTYQARAQAKNAEIAREWKKDLPPLKMVLKAKTKYANEVMYASVEFIGFPEFLNYGPNFNEKFTLQWNDADGFTRIEKEIKISDMTAFVDSSGKREGLSAQFTQAATLDDYVKLSGLSVGWTLKVETPKAAASPLLAAPAKPQRPPEDLTDADHCAPGISREERLRRLAAHGRVRETGLGEYTAGTRQVNILSSGQLLSCR
ncbi:MAG: hypothetical protein Q7K25_03055 [Actinomycetota bacterium]|nr:hypothetical protein [Actinomycetota bacterium]